MGSPVLFSRLPRGVSTTSRSDLFALGHGRAVQRAAMNQLTVAVVAVSILAVSCGVETEADQQDSVDGEIIGGNVAAPGEFPHQVALFARKVYQSFTYDQFHCGGSLLSPEWVLTAAHCATNYAARPLAPASLRVAAGITRLTEVPRLDINVDLIDSNAANVFTVKEVFVYPYYQGANGTANYMAGDIALLHLSRPAPQSPIALATASDDSAYATAGRYVTASGWGSVAGNGARYPNAMRKGTLKLPARDACVGRAKSAFNATVSAAEELCAVSPNDGDTCFGDSGGPLMVTTAAGTQLLLGVTSWGGAKCGVTGEPGYYARVSRYHTWLKTCVAGGNCPALK